MCVDSAYPIQATRVAGNGSGEKHLTLTAGGLTDAEEIHSSIQGPDPFDQKVAIIRVPYEGDVLCMTSFKANALWLFLGSRNQFPISQVYDTD